MFTCPEPTPRLLCAGGCVALALLCLTVGSHMSITEEVTSIPICACDQEDHRNPREQSRRALRTV